MKKAIIILIFISLGSILVTRVTRYSFTQTAVVFEWLAALALAVFVLVSVWAGGKIFIWTRRRKALAQ